jgi:hypothetical protein
MCQNRTNPNLRSGLVFFPTTHVTVNLFAKCCKVAWHLCIAQPFGVTAMKVSELLPWIGCFYFIECHALHIFHFLPWAFFISLGGGISFLGLEFFHSCHPHFLFLALGFFDSLPWNFFIPVYIFSFLPCTFLIPCPGVFSFPLGGISFLTLGIFISTLHIFHSCPAHFSFLGLAIFHSPWGAFHSLPWAFSFLPTFFIPCPGFFHSQGGGISFLILGFFHFLGGGYFIPYPVHFLFPLRGIYFIVLKIAKKIRKKIGMVYRMSGIAFGMSKKGNIIGDV